MKLETGEIITLDNNKEYICCSTFSDAGIDYVFLMSNFKPLEIRFAKQRLVDDEVEITIIADENEKQRVLELFSKQKDFHIPQEN